MREKGRALKRVLVSSLLALFLSGVCVPAQAARLEAGDLIFGINGFLGVEYTYMSELPIVMDESGTPAIMTMDEASFLNLRHLNLLFTVEREKFRSLINLHSSNFFETNEDQNTFKGGLEIQEAYGEYSFRETARVRAGNFLAPFGIYNDVKYLLPVFSSVVLPTIYEPPRNYSEPVVPGQPVMPIGPLTPDNGNLMLWGLFLGEPVNLKYHLYVTSGEKGPEGVDRDKDLGLGARVLLSYFDTLRAGGSFYTVHNKDAPEGRERLFGGDMTLNLFSRWTLQAEYVTDWFSDRKQRDSYYIFTGYQYGQWNPYLRYDFLEDPEHLLFKRKQERYTAGLGYRFNPNIHLKGEFHLHRILDDAGLPDDLEQFTMIRTSIIFIF